MWTMQPLGISVTLLDMSMYFNALKHGAGLYIMMTDNPTMITQFRNYIPKKWIIVFFPCVATGIFFIYINDWKLGSSNIAFTSDGEYSDWPQLSVHPAYSQKWLRKTCAVNSYFSIPNLQNVLEKWSIATDDGCRELYTKFKAIYSVTKHSASLLLPNPFRQKVKKWLGYNNVLFQRIYKQEVIHVINHFTREHTIFNPLRDQRPMSKPEEPEIEYIEKLTKATKDSCDFCKFKNFTAEHLMHRVESRYSYSASNAFKLEKWHALFATKTHHPLNWSQEIYMDLMNTSLTWFLKAHRSDPVSQFPVMVWDMFPHAGASQIHPHMHGLLDPTSYHGVVETWRMSAEEYYRHFVSNYFSDLINIYSALGLTVEHGDAVAFANLVPKKDHEVVVISPNAGRNFFELIYFILRAFIEDLKKLCFSMGIGFPPLNPSTKGRIPAYARIVTRGAVADVRSDMSSFELFTATNVNVDPYKVIDYIKKSVEKRSKAKYNKNL